MNELALLLGLLLNHGGGGPLVEVKTNVVVIKPVVVIVNVRPVLNLHLRE